MKLNLNAKELLSLHNMLHERFADGKRFAEDDPRGIDDTQLRQVYNRLRACLVAALTNKVIDPVEAYLNHEQTKIDNLKEANDAIRKEQTVLGKTINDVNIVVPDEGEDLTEPEYPRRGQRNRGGNQGRGKR